MVTVRTLTLSVLSLVASGLIATAASAETPFQAHHPRQAEVLKRDAHQRALIHEERREGDLSKAKARHLLAVDRRIAHRDHVLARAHGGHITRHEQRVLNHEESRVGQRIPG
jgi:hypothetical protein